MLRAEHRSIGTASLPDGSRVTVRAACPWDAARVQDYVRSLLPSSRYDRFLAPLNELSPGELARIGADGETQATLIAEMKIAGARVIIGEARYAVDGDACEIALSVGEAWRGRGVGTLLLDILECRARSFRAGKLIGDVLRSNAAMRTLARKSGFDQAGVPADARLVRIVKDISAARVGTPCAQLATSGLQAAA
jgi:RimJ/RimL family protein N-acetyltransferase